MVRKRTPARSAEFFLGALIGEQRAHAHRLRCVQERAADIAHVDIAGMGARRQRAGAQQHADDHRSLHIRQFLAHLGEVTADDVAAFVGEHADHLIGRGRLHQSAGIHEDAVCVHDERVEIRVVDDDDLNVLRGEARGLENRRRVIAQELFDLGVANHRNAGVGPGLRTCWNICQQACQRDCCGSSKRDCAQCWLRRPYLARRSSDNHVN